MFQYFSEEFVLKSPFDAAQLVHYMKDYEKRSSVKQFVKKIELQALIETTLVKEGTKEGSKQLQSLIKTLIQTKIILVFLQKCWENRENWDSWSRSEDLQMLDWTVQHWIHFWICRWLFRFIVLRHFDQTIRMYDRNSDNSAKRSCWNKCLKDNSADPVQREFDPAARKLRASIVTRSECVIVFLLVMFTYMRPTDWWSSLVLHGITNIEKNEHHRFQLIETGINIILLLPILIYLHSYEWNFNMVVCCRHEWLIKHGRARSFSVLIPLALCILLCYPYHCFRLGVAACAIHNITINVISLTHFWWLPIVQNPMRWLPELFVFVMLILLVAQLSGVLDVMTALPTMVDNHWEMLIEFIEKYFLKKK